MDTIRFEIENVESSPRIDILINEKSLADIIGKEKCKEILSIIFECYMFREGSEWGCLCFTDEFETIGYSCYRKENTVRLSENEWGLFNFEFERKQFEKAIADARSQHAGVMERIANEEEKVEKLYEDDLFDIFHKTTIKVDIPWWNHASLIESIVYQTQEKFYIISDKQTGEKYLFHFESNTFTNMKNTHPMMTGRNVFKKSKGLVEFFINELSKKPETYQKHFYLGVYYFLIRNYPETISHYEKVIECEKHFEYNALMDNIIYHDLGIAYYNMKNYKAASNCIDILAGIDVGADYFTDGEDDAVL
jgi:tetratricopeptide (TPR) repeat protein